MRVLKAQLVVYIIQDTLLGFTQLNFDLLYILDCVCAQHKCVFDFSFVLLHFFFFFILHSFLQLVFGRQERCPKPKSNASSLQLHRFNKKTQRCIRRQKKSQIKFLLALTLVQLLNFVSVFYDFCKRRTMFFSH